MSGPVMLPTITTRPQPRRAIHKMYEETLRAQYGDDVFSTRVPHAAEFPEAIAYRKPIAQYKDPQPCPECSQMAPRVMLTAPLGRGTGSQDSGGGGSPAWLSGMKRSHGGGCACC